MGARHSKRSMDVTTTPKKEGLPAEGGDAAAVGDGKLERIEEADVKPTTNGVAPHTDASDDKDSKDKDATTEKEEKKETKEDEEAKVDETKAETPSETPAEGGDATTPTEGTPASPTSVTSPDTKESKKKEKSKKKWSFRTISFGRKDKTKPVREDTPKNGDVSKDEPLPEGGEEAETVEATSPAEDKSAVASPTESEPPTEAKEADKPVEETKIEPTTTTPAPTPLPDVNKEDDKIIKNIEVSHVEAEIVEPMVEVTTNTQPIVTASIIEMKTSEDFPSQFPSSPPPTPIDPSPIQQAAANANELAEALKLPAESETNDAINKLDAQVIPEIDKSSDNEEVELVVNSEEGPVPVSNYIPIEVPKEIVESPEESKSIDELSEEPETIEYKIVEEIVIEEVDKIDENIPVEEVEIEVIEEPDVDIPAPPPLVEIAANVDEEFIVEEEIPPPLPESPIPLPKASADLLNFMSSQISENPPLSEIIDCVASAHETIEESTTHQLPSQHVDEKIESHGQIDLIKTESLLTPPRSPSPIPPQNESSLFKLNDNDSNELRNDTVTNNHTNNSEINREERIAESNNVDIAKQLPLTNDITINQSIAEPETPVEKISEPTTESVEEAPKSPAPAVPAEVPAPAAPVITEDVASVTKAIEEIDINEKAVAAAVNENIDSVNTNEIIADMNHQNNLNE